MKQIIFEVHHLLSANVVTSMPLDIDDGCEEEMLTKAKAGIEAVLDSGGRLTIQTAKDAFVILPPDLLKQCAAHIRLQDRLDPHPYTDARS